MAVLGAGSVLFLGLPTTTPNSVGWPLLPLVLFLLLGGFALPFSIIFRGLYKDHDFLQGRREWFRKESHGWLRQVLGASPLVQELFAPAEIERMLVAHGDGSANYTRELRALAALGLWDARR